MRLTRMAADSPTLLRSCAQNLKDSMSWAEFHRSFERRIVAYLLRAFVAHGGTVAEFIGFAQDWTQDVFLRLVQHDARVLKSVRGTTDTSAAAFLACIARSVVVDHLRNKLASKRLHAECPIENVPEPAATSAGQAPSGDMHDAV